MGVTQGADAVPIETVGVDMTAKFLALFTWGFALYMFIPASLCIFAGLLFTGNAIMIILGVAILLSSVYSPLVWSIVVACNIWSQEGKACAGRTGLEAWTDPQDLANYMMLTMPASYNFPNIVTWILFVSCGCLCV